MDLFFPAIDEKAIEQKMRAAGFDFAFDLMSYSEYRETCPKCEAEPGELCTRRGKPVDSHQGRRNVALLRYVRAWVPKPGDKVYLGDLDGPYKHGACIFKRFTPKGEAEVDDLGKNWTFKFFETCDLWPMSAVVA